MPRGIYLLGPPGQSHSPLALFCLPPSLARKGRARGYLGIGFCPGSAAALLKPVVGRPGDRIDITQHGVWRNGILIPNSTPLASDRSGRPLQVPEPSSFIVPADSFFPLSTYSPYSWDGRYWGTLPLSAIEATASPLFLDDPLPNPLATSTVQPHP